MYQKMPRITFKNVTKVLTPEDITNAELFWILQAQKIMHEDLKKGQYKGLCPRKRNDGIYTVGGRSQRWMEMSYNKQEIILPPHEHRFSKLYTEHKHQRRHLGVLSTASKIRSRFWIIRLLPLRTFAPILLRTKFTCHVMHRARALSSKVNNYRANGHSCNFAWI